MIAYPTLLRAEDVLALRASKNLSLAKFWGRIGVPSADGSRFESGKKKLPDSLRFLLSIAYGDMPYRVVARLREEG